MKRALDQWSALHAYFDREAENDKAARVSRLNQHLKSPLTKLVMLFLEFALDSLMKFNAVFQSSLPMLPHLKSEVKRLLRIQLGRFIKCDIIIAAGKELSQIDLNDANSLLPDEELGVGHKTLLYLSEEEDYFDSSVKEIFYNGVKEFYIAIVSTIFKFDDEFMDDVAFFSVCFVCAMPCLKVSSMS